MDPKNPKTELYVRPLRSLYGERWVSCLCTETEQRGIHGEVQYGKSFAIFMHWYSCTQLSLSRKAWEEHGVTMTSLEAVECYSIFDPARIMEHEIQIDQAECKINPAD